MPRNSSGTYTLPAGNPVVSGTLIEASWANTTLSDLASAMTESLSRDGEGGMTAALRLYDGTVSLPGLAFSNETSSGLYRAGTADIRLSVTGADVAQFLATGVAVTGTLSASGNFAINTDKFTVAASSGNTAVAGTLAVTGAATLSSTLAVTGASTFSGQTNTFENSTAYYPQLINRNKTNDANGSYISLQKIRNTSIVQNGDVLGNVIFAGYDGAAYLQGAYINAVISATPGTNDMPTDLAFGTTADGGSGPTERMRIDKAGNLGLGVTPSAWTTLKVMQFSGGASLGGYSNTGYLNANSYFDGSWRYIASTSAGRYEVAADHKWFSAASGTAGAAITFTQAMTLDASGNLGIQNTSPSSTANGQNTLVIGSGSANDRGITIYTGSSNAGTLAFADGTTGSENYRGYLQYTHSNDALAIATAGAERARIDSSGNLLINETARWRGTGILSINTGANDGIAVQTASAGLIVRKTAYSNSYIGLWENNGGTAVGSITTNGSTTAYNTSSDYRLKENIQPMTGALAKVAALKPVTYTWKESGQTDEGFIAHELQEVCPSAVSGAKDATEIKQYEISPAVPATFDEEGNELTPAVEAVMGEREVPVYQGIDTSFLVATLTAAIQEQQAIIEGLTARISALEAPAQ